MTKFKRPIPDVTPTSSFSKLTKFLIFSFQKKDRKLVRDILVQRENGLKDQLHIIQQERDSVKEERDLMEKSCEELKRERDLCKSKLCWAEMDRERLQEKMRRELDRRVEVMEVREKSLEDALVEMKEQRDVMENNLRMEMELSRESYKKLEGKLRSEIEALEGENRVLHEKNEECSEKLKMVQEILAKREKELEDEAEKRENYEKELKRVHVVELRKVEGRIEELEVENREWRNKIEISSETLGKEFAIFEERLAKMKGAFGSVCSGNAEADRASGNGSHERVVSITDSHHKVKTESSFLEYEADDGGRSENNINCKRKRSIDQTEGGKDSIPVHKKIECLQESGCKKISLPIDFVAHGVPKANSPPKFSSACISQCKDENRRYEKSELHFTKSICGVVDGTDRCYRADPHDASLENSAVMGFQSGKEIRWKHKADMLSAFKNTPQLCMAAVCALYRQTISAMVSKEGGGFSSIDIVRGTDAAKYLINSDPECKLTRSVLEVQQNRPNVFKICQKLAFQYDEQLFRIYQKELDPFFCPKS